MTYYIIPNNNIAMEIDAETPEQALEGFAWGMDSDMNTYFKAVTEDEYKQLQEEKKYKAYKEQQLELRTEDAKNRMIDSIDYYIEDEDKAKAFLESVPREDYEEIAKRFIDRYDGKTAENDIFDWLIEEYVSDRLADIEYEE